MKLRCKPGDLAVIVNSTRKKHRYLIGYIGVIKGRCHVYEDSWDFDPPLITNEGREASIKDCNLRPLRDSDGEDETFTWAGKPEEVKA